MGEKDLKAISGNRVKRTSALYYVIFHGGGSDEPGLEKTVEFKKERKK